jgi:predicted transcriptional regulator
MKTDVYTWRLSRELKADLERQARLRDRPVSFLLELAVRQWLERTMREPADDDAQAKLHAAAKASFGVISSGHSDRSESVRKNVRKRLRRRQLAR